MREIEEEHRAVQRGERREQPQAARGKRLAYRESLGDGSHRRSEASADEDAAARLRRVKPDAAPGLVL
jgi:hypothetical protein